jgi:hypothetical protein
MWLDTPPAHQTLQDFRQLPTSLHICVAVPLGAETDGNVWRVMQIFASLSLQQKRQPKRKVNFVNAEKRVVINLELPDC